MSVKASLGTGPRLEKAHDRRQRQGDRERGLNSLIADRGLGHDADVVLWPIHRYQRLQRGFGRPEFRSRSRQKRARRLGEVAPTCTLFARYVLKGSRAQNDMSLCCLAWAVPLVLKNNFQRHPIELGPPILEQGKDNALLAPLRPAKCISVDGKGLRYV